MAFIANIHMHLDQSWPRYHELLNTTDVISVVRSDDLTIEVDLTYAIMHVLIDKTHMSIEVNLKRCKRTSATDKWCKNIARQYLLDHGTANIDLRNKRVYFDIESIDGDDDMTGYVYVYTLESIMKEICDLSHGIEAYKKSTIELHKFDVPFHIVDKIIGCAYSGSRDDVVAQAKHFSTQVVERPAACRTLAF